MLNVGVPRRDGLLRRRVLGILRAAGIELPPRPDNHGHIVGGVRWWSLHVADIAAYLAANQLHAGWTGQNLLAEHDGHAVIEDVAITGTETSLVVAAPAHRHITSLDQLAGAVVATSYPRLVTRWAWERRLPLTINELRGACETAPGWSNADAVIESAHTGRSLRCAGFSLLRDPDDPGAHLTLMSSRLVLAHAANLDPQRSRAAGRLAEIVRPVATSTTPGSVVA